MINSDIKKINNLIKKYKFYKELFNSVIQVSKLILYNLSNNGLNIIFINAILVVINNLKNVFMILIILSLLSLMQNEKVLLTL